MKRILTKASVLGVLLAAGMLRATLNAADLTGDWVFRWNPDFSGNVVTRECMVKQDGPSLTMTCGEDTPIRGMINGQKVTFQFMTGAKGDVTGSLSGELDERMMTVTGTWHLSDPVSRNGEFDAKKR